MELTEEQSILKDQARRLLSEESHFDRLRELAGSDHAYDQETWRQAAELGWQAVLVPEAFGGLGLGLTEACVLAEELGRSVAAIPYTQSAVLFTHAIVQLADAAEKERILPALAEGKAIGCIAFAEEGSAAIPGDPQVAYRGGALYGTKPSAAGSACASHSIVYAKCAESGELGLYLVALEDPAVTVKVGTYLDDNMQYADLCFDGARATALASDAESSLANILDTGALAYAFEQVGGAEACLDMASAYALERKAFGQLIGGFQAIKHNLAEMYTLVQLARGAASKALLAQLAGSARRVAAFAAARFAASRAFEYCAKENIQIHGGIGITWEANCHFYYRRSKTLAMVLGGAPYWADRLVNAVAAQGQETDELAGRVEPDDLKRFRVEAREWLTRHAPAYSAKALEGLSEEAWVAKAKEWMALRAKHGYAAIVMPKRYGGGGGTIIQKLIYEEEESRFETPSHLFHISQGMPLQIVCNRATDAQKEDLLPAGIRGDTIWCQLFSEPSAGTDLAAVRLTATRDGDNWILNGQKLWTSWAHVSDYGILLARTDADVPKHRGMTFFFVDLRVPGVEVRKVRRFAGKSEINEVFFNDVVVPDSYRLGEVGEGWKVALETLMIERYSVTDVSGYGPKIEAYFALAKNTLIENQPAIQDGRVQYELADLYAREQGLRHIQAEAFAALAAGKEPGPEGSICKLVSANNRQRIGAVALDLLGPTGASLAADAKSASCARFSWLEVPPFRIAGGTDETLRNTIAERILGMPGDYKPDKNVPFREA
ncbi:MAG: acyl-CoA dehydrogenase [Gammaproteobacteria bacterium]|nr:acyl-CoA dehydrogenase [Gammaproteobacteria bacterium]